jgi:hypothetical protein
MARLLKSRNSAVFRHTLPHWPARGAFELAPTDRGAFDRAQNSFPDAGTEHGAMDQAGMECFNRATRKCYRILEDFL